jgi:hypothetical protein
MASSAPKQLSKATLPWLWTAWRRSLAFLDSAPGDHAVMLLDKRLQHAFSLSLVSQLLASHARTRFRGFGILGALLPAGLSRVFAGILRHFVFARYLLGARIEGLPYRRGQPEGKPGCD